MVTALVIYHSGAVRYASGAQLFNCSQHPRIQNVHHTYSVQAVIGYSVSICTGAQKLSN